MARIEPVFQGHRTFVSPSEVTYTPGRRQLEYATVIYAETHISIRCGSRQGCSAEIHALGLSHVCFCVRDGHVPVPSLARGVTTNFEILTLSMGYASNCDCLGICVKSCRCLSKQILAISSWQPLQFNEPSKFDIQSDIHQAGFERSSW